MKFCHWSSLWLQHWRTLLKSAIYLQTFVWSPGEHRQTHETETVLRLKRASILVVKTGTQLNKIHFQLFNYFCWNILYRWVWVLGSALLFINSVNLGSFLPPKPLLLQTQNEYDNPDTVLMGIRSERLGFFLSLNKEYNINVICTNFLIKFH